MSSRSDRVAFVLSGAASRGAVRVGMLHALYERGIVPQLIVGTSAGAVNGAFIAARPQTMPTARELASIWLGLRRGQIFPSGRRFSTRMRRHEQARRVRKRAAGITKRA